MGETIKVATEAFEGGFMVIDKTDFDPATMVEFGVMPEPEEPVFKAAKKSK